jgi:hypothetical protein
MMSDSDKANLLALMYQSDDEEDVEVSSEPKPERPYGIMSMPAMSSMLRKMQAQLELQDRTISRLRQRIRNLEKSTGSLGRQITTLDGDMANKVDRRG